LVSNDFYRKLPPIAVFYKYPWNAQNLKTSQHVIAVMSLVRERANAAHAYNTTEKAKSFPRAFFPLRPNVLMTGRFAISLV
jgi:hypothetical protein